MDAAVLGGIDTVFGVPLLELEDGSAELGVASTSLSGGVGIIENNDSVQLERSPNVSW